MEEVLRGLPQGVLILCLFLVSRSGWKLVIQINQTFPSWQKVSWHSLREVNWTDRTSLSDPKCEPWGWVWACYICGGVQPISSKQSQPLSLLLVCHQPRGSYSAHMTQPYISQVRQDHRAALSSTQLLLQLPSIFLFSLGKPFSLALNLSLNQEKYLSFLSLLKCFNLFLSNSQI